MPSFLTGFVLRKFYFIIVLENRRALKPAY